MKAHAFDPWSFIFGVLFVLMGGTFLLVDEPFPLFTILSYSGDWLIPIVVLVIGVALLVSTVGRWRRPAPEPAPAFEEIPAEVLAELPPEPMD
jgi:cytochrome c-type biogenesis protein CcmH/NrfF